MGTCERRQRDFEARERLFLEKSREQIRANGLLNLQVAKIAEGADYATGTLYQHFASKEDLLLALTAQSSGQRLTFFSKAAAWSASSRDRMLAIAVADIAFVKRFPEHFKIEQMAMNEVVWGRASKLRRRALIEAKAPLGAVVESIVAEAKGNGDLPSDCPMRPKDIVAGCWSLCLGMHSIIHADGVPEFLQLSEPYRLMCWALQCFLNGVGWRPLFDVRDVAGLDALIERLKNEVFA